MWNASWFVKLSVCGTVTNGARGRASVVEPCSVLHVSGYGIYSLRGVECVGEEGWVSNDRRKGKRLWTSPLE